MTSSKSSIWNEKFSFFLPKFEKYFVASNNAELHICTHFKPAVNVI
jgi:hypothetical protein